MADSVAIDCSVGDRVMLPRAACISGEVSTLQTLQSLLYTGLTEIEVIPDFVVYNET